MRNKNIGIYGRRLPDEAAKLLENGCSPDEVVQAFPKYKKHMASITHAFINMHLKNAPIHKDIHTEWHICSTDISKKLYEDYCNEYGQASFYRCSLSAHNAFDGYFAKGAPPTLFISNYDGCMDYEQFLSFLDVDVMPRPDFMLAPDYRPWTTCIVTSALPPDEIYMCPEPYYLEDYEQKRKNIAAPLLRRLDTITYHYKEAGIDKAFTMLAEDYRDFSDLKRRARRYKDMKFYN